jgi:hypothetical protein
MDRNQSTGQVRRLVEAEIKRHAAEKEAERGTQEQAHGQAQAQVAEQQEANAEVEIKVKGFEDDDYGEDNGYESADEEFARQPNSEEDVIDVIIAMSELESNQVDQQ